MREKVTGIVVVLVLCACGDDGSGSPDSEDAGGTSGGGAAGTGGGTAGTGGASGGAAGAAEDSGGAAGGGGIARGAVSLHILSSTGCSLPDQFQDLPQLASGHPVTDTQKVQALEDGTMTADGQPVDVLCNWLGEQSPYILDAVIDIGVTDRRGLNLGFTMTPGQTDTGGLVFWSPEFPADYGARAEPCMYSVIEFDETTRSVWGSLACSSFAPLDGSDSCALGPSYFFFENCTIVR